MKLSKRIRRARALRYSKAALNAVRQIHLEIMVSDLFRPSALLNYLREAKPSDFLDPDQGWSHIYNHNRTELRDVQPRENPATS